MTSIWLIANSKSRTTDADVIDQACGLIKAEGVELEQRIDLSEADLPDASAGLPDMIVSLGGDGTANAVIERYGADDGPRLLILPGGTMNLLSGKLHGDADIGDIIERAFSFGRERRLPLIKGPDFQSFVGMIAGPATAWGEVREDIRAGAVEDLADDVREALSATFEAPGVRLAGEAESHAALFVEPLAHGLAAHAIHADSLADLALHGWAWLNRDFLGGPTVELARGERLTLESERGEAALLVDGERCRAASPLVLDWAQCPARFIGTLES